MGTGERFGTESPREVTEAAKNGRCFCVYFEVLSGYQFSGQRRRGSVRTTDRTLPAGMCPEGQFRRRMMMRLGKVFIASVAACSAVATSASAAITAFWQQNVITPAAIANAAILGTSQSWSLMVTTDGDWASSGMRATLPAGSAFYNNSFGSNTRPGPDIVGAFPAAAYDTYVSGPGDTGDANDPNNNPPGLLGGHPAGSASSFTGTTVSASWFNLTVDVPGTYEIARLTFPQGVIPVIFEERVAGQLALPNSSNTSQVNPESFTFIPQIPEPASLGLLAAVGLLATRRRHD